MNVEAFATQNPVNHSPNSEPPEEQPKTMQDLDEYLSGDFAFEELKRGDIRQGVVVEISDNGVIMDIGSKREGLVPAEDLTRLDDDLRETVQIGATIPVFVLNPADKEGRPILSINQAQMYKDWIKAEEMMEEGELYEGEISAYNRGGVIVKFGRIRGFVPASQLVGLPRRMREEQRRERLAEKVGETVGLKIIEVDRRRRRLIFSQRRALRVWQEMQRERVMEELSEGETRHGEVTSLTDFGAFVDLGGADGLVHVSELSWQRVNHPRDVLKVGDEVDVYVLNVDRDRKRIALSIKKLQPDPWTLVDQQYSVGQLVEGRVTRVLDDLGAFVALESGIEGLLHSTEMIGTPELAPSDIVQSGDKLPVKIVNIESHRHRISLSAKQVGQDEWERWMAEQQLAEAAAESAEAKEAAAEPAEAKEAAAEPAEAKEAAAEPAEAKEAAAEPAEAKEAAAESAEAEEAEESEEEAEVSADQSAPAPAEETAEAEGSEEPVASEPAKDAA